MQFKLIFNHHWCKTLACTSLHASHLSGFRVQKNSFVSLQELPAVEDMLVFYCSFSHPIQAIHLQRIPSRVCTVNHPACQKRRKEGRL